MKKIGTYKTKMAILSVMLFSLLQLEWKIMGNISKNFHLFLRVKR